MQNCYTIHFFLASLPPLSDIYFRGLIPVFLARLTFLSKISTHVLVEVDNEELCEVVLGAGW